MKLLLNQILISNMAEKIFAGGMRFERPAPNAPEWIKGKLSFKVDEAIDFLKKHKSEKGWVNVDLKASKEGKLYLELNTFSKTKVENNGEVANPPDDFPFPSEQ